MELDRGVSAGADLLSTELAEEGSTSLLVAIDEQDILAARGTKDRQVDCDRGLPDPALGVPYSNDHAISPLRFRCGAIYDRKLVNVTALLSVQPCADPLPCPAVGIGIRTIIAVRYTGCVEVLTQSDGETSRPDATGPDMPRRVATEADDYISLKEAREIFIAQKRPVSERTLQRSCVKGHIVGKKIVTAEGEKWFALKSSVLNRIAELAKFDELRERTDAARRDVSRRVARENQMDSSDDMHRQGTSENVTHPVVSAQESHSTPSDTSRPDATGNDMSEVVARIDALQQKMLELTEAQIDELKNDKKILLEQLAVKDKQLQEKDMQIGRFFTSERETKTLFGRVTGMLNGIWPNKAPGDRYVPESEALGSGLEHLQEDQER